MTPADFIFAARVPLTLRPQSFGLWHIDRVDRNWDDATPLAQTFVGFDSMTVLRRFDNATIHLNRSSVVMEDSRRELSRHLPIWLAARDRVLVTGLGLGCVVRGLLASPTVERVDVVEIDADIIRVVGAEFAGDPRITIHHGDALEFAPEGARWDFAWHDLHSFDAETHLQHLHAQLIIKFMPVCARQGAWGFPRIATRRLPMRLLGAPK